MKPQYPPPELYCEFLEHYKDWDLWFCPGAIPELVAIKNDESEIGLERARTGECWILSYALGVAKTNDLYKEPYEQDFLVNSAIGYLVMGRTGQYSDEQVWPVFFTLNRERAEKCKMVLNSQASTWEQHRGDSYSSPPHGWSQIDPNMKCDDRTLYYVIPIKHESDPRRISFATEICPECNSQVFDTSHGLICERGHSL